MSLGLLAAIGAAVFIIYLVMRDSSPPEDPGKKPAAAPSPGKGGSKLTGPSAARRASAASTGGASKTAAKSDGDLKSEYESLMTELSGVFGAESATKPSKGDMAKLQRLGRLGETPTLKGVVDKAAVLGMLEAGMARIDDVYGAGNATGKTRLEAYEKSAKKLSPRKKKAEPAAKRDTVKPRTGKFGLPFDVEAFAACFPEGWALVDKKEDEWLIMGPGESRIAVGPHQLTPSSDLFGIVQSYPSGSDSHEPIESFTTSIGTRGWSVVVTEDGASHAMVELWGPALMSVRFIYASPEFDPSIRQTLQQAAMNLTWLNAAVTRSDDLPIKNIRELHRHIRTVLREDEELRDAVLSSFEDDQNLMMFTHEIEAVADVGARAYPLVRALIRYSLAHEVSIDVDDLCKLQSWCGVHFLNDPDLGKIIAEHAERAAESTEDFLELATAAKSVGDNTRETALVHRALAAAKSTDDHVTLASHPAIAGDPSLVRSQLDAALAAATDVGDLRKVLDHNAATPDLLPIILERLRTSCSDKAFLSSAWNPLDVLHLANEKNFMSREEVEAEILAMVETSPLLADSPEPVKEPESTPPGEDDTDDDDELDELLGSGDAAMKLLDLAETAHNAEWDGLREALLTRAELAAHNADRKYALYQFFAEKLEDQTRADAYLEQNRAVLQPFLDKKRESENQESLMDAICQCALLVAVGDGRITSEEKEEIQKVRPIIEMMYRNREAISVLEQTGDIDKARDASGLTIIVHSLASMWFFEPAYSQEIGEHLEDVTSLEELDALFRMYAARVEDPFGRRLAAWAATEVASIDGFDDGEKRALKIMADVWELDLKENQRYFRDLVYPIINDDIEYTGHGKGSALDRAREFDARLREEGGDEAMNTLAEALGVDSMEALVRLLGDDDEQEEEVEDTKEFPPAFLAVLTKMDWDEALRLIRGGEDVHATINMGGIAGLSLLNIAAEHGTVKVVRALVEAGADVNQAIRNPKHIAGYNTPLVTSLKGAGRIDIFDFLLEAGASPDPFADGEAGWTPLTMAAETMNSEAIVTLLDRGVDVNIARNNGSNAFKILSSCDAAEFPKARECMDLLIKAGIDTARTDKEGFAGIHNAAPRWPVEAVAYLIDVAQIPVDLAMRNRPHALPTPFLRALEWGNVAVADYLLSKGADPTAKSKFMSKGVVYAICNAGMKGSMSKPVPQLRKYGALGIKPTLEDVKSILMLLSHASDEHARRIGPMLDEVVASLEFTSDELTELDGADLADKITEALGAAPKLTERLLKELKKRGVDLSALSKASEDGDDVLTTLAKAYENAPEGEEWTPRTDAFVDAVKDAVERRGGSRLAAFSDLWWSFGTDAATNDSILNAFVASKSDEELAGIVEQKADELFAKQQEKGEDEDSDTESKITVTFEGFDDEDETSEPQRALLPFDAKKNSFLQASMCIYQAAAGDGLFNDEEIDGFIAANEELSRVYDLPDDADLIKTGVKAQKTVDAVYAKYSTIPLDEIHRNARKLATRIDDPFLQKVIVLLSIKAADADDDLNDYEMQVINIYLEKWNLSLDEVEEVDGEF